MKIEIVRFFDHYCVYIFSENKSELLELAKSNSIKYNITNKEDDDPSFCYALIFLTTKCIYKKLTIPAILKRKWLDCNFALFSFDDITLIETDIGTIVYKSSDKDSNS